MSAAPPSEPAHGRFKDERVDVLVNGHRRWGILLRVEKGPSGNLAFVQLDKPFLGDRLIKVPEAHIVRRPGDPS